MTRSTLLKFILLLMLLLLAACSGNDEDEDQATNPPPTSTLTPATPVPATEEAADPVVEETAAPVDTATAEATAESAATEEATEVALLTITPVEQLEDSDQLLVWTAPAASPGTHRADATGELVYVDNTGTVTSLVAVPEQASHVEPCGVNAISPDGRYFAFFMGLSTQLGGSLHMMTDGNPPVVVEEDMQLLGCRGGDSRLQYSPDSSQIAYVAYEEDAAGSEFGDGTLHVRNTSDLSEIATFDNVVSFDIGADGVAFVNFYTNNRDQADEAAIFWWDGSSAETEVTTFTPGENCRFVSSYTQIAPDGQLWTILGERCPNSGTEWQLYRVDVANQNALLSLAQPAAGAMVSYSEINNLFFTPDNARMYFTLPDGVSNNSVSLHMVSLDDLAAPREIVARNLRVATYSGSASASPLLSPDGTKLAFVHSTPDFETQLHIYDMTNPDAAPIIIDAENAGDNIPFMQYAPDGTLVYIVGESDGGDNAIFVLRPGSVQADRVRRGTYSSWAALSPDGNKLAVLEWVPKDQGVRGNPYLNLMIVDLTTREAGQLAQGGEIAANQTTNLQFARPLLWVRK